MPSGSRLLYISSTRVYGRKTGPEPVSGLRGERARDAPGQHLRLPQAVRRGPLPLGHAPLRERGPHRAHQQCLWPPPEPASETVISDFAPGRREPADRPARPSRIRAELLQRPRHRPGSVEVPGTRPTGMRLQRCLGGTHDHTQTWLCRSPPCFPTPWPSSGRPTGSTSQRSGSRLPALPSWGSRLVIAFINSARRRSPGHCVAWLIPAPVRLHHDVPRRLHRDGRFPPKPHTTPRRRHDPSRTDYRGLLVIIPTRNRVDLAIRAVQSALASPEDEVRILVSDNSTEDDQVRQLRDFCGSFPPERVQYIRPESSLGMCPHWDWILGRVLAESEVNHFTFLTDRFTSKPDSLPRLCALARTFPDSVISYHYDRVLDLQPPIRLDRKPWSGQVLEFAAADILRANAADAMVIARAHPAQQCRAAAHARARPPPAPRGFLPVDRARLRFRLPRLDVEDSILFYDKSLVITSSLGRSNGYSFTRGVENGAAGTSSSTSLTRPSPPAPRSPRSTPRSTAPYTSIFSPRRNPPPASFPPSTSRPTCRR